MALNIRSYEVPPLGEVTWQKPALEKNAHTQLVDAFAPRERNIAVRYAPVALTASKSCVTAGILPAHNNPSGKIERPPMIPATKCAHEACNCAAPEGEKYCSTECASTVGSTSNACKCGHPGCLQ